MDAHFYALYEKLYRQQNRDFPHFWNLFETFGLFAGESWYHGYWLAWVENSFARSQLVSFSNTSTQRQFNNFMCCPFQCSKKWAGVPSDMPPSTSKGSAWQKHVRSDSLSIYSRYKSRQLCSHHAWKAVWQLVRWNIQTVNRFLLRDLNLAKQPGMIMNLAGFFTMAQPLVRMNVVSFSLA